MQHQHTPMPWTATDFNDATNRVDEYHIFIEPSVAVIEKKIEGHNQNDWADARLIAAAPELLEALKELHDIVQGLIDDGHARSLGLDSFTLQPASAAIAKATGGANE